MNNLNSSQHKFSTQPESKNNIEGANYYKELISHAKIISTNARDFFGEENYIKYNLDNFISFIRSSDGESKDLLIVENGIIIFLPFKSFAIGVDIYRRKNGELIKLLNKYYEENKYKKYFSPGKIGESSINHIFLDFKPNLEMKTIMDTNIIYDYIDNNRKKTINDYSQVGSLIGIKSDYPLPGGYFVKVNGASYYDIRDVERKNVSYVDNVTDVIGNPITDIKNIGTYDTNNSMITFINTKGDKFVTRYSSYAIELLEMSGYKKGDMNVPFSNGEAGGNLSPNNILSISKDIMDKYLEEQKTRKEPK